MPYQQRNDGSREHLIENVYLAGSLLATRTVVQGSGQSAKVLYQHTDALGTPTAVTDSSGKVTERSEYEPYGLLVNRPLTDGIGYTGHVQDAATGLTYMQQRYYDPILGRFLSVDAVTAYSMPGSNFNRYWYANNNPYKFTDPDGRIAETIWDAANVGMGVASAYSNFSEGNIGAGVVDSLGVVVDAAATAIPIVPGGAGAAIKAVRAADKAVDGAKASKAAGPYKRPSNATTRAQRESVQGKPCVKCGSETPKQVAGHKQALVKEYHETGSIDKGRMRSNDAVQSECPTCSAREGADMSRYSREMNKQFKDP